MKFTCFLCQHFRKWDRQTDGHDDSYIYTYAPTLYWSESLQDKPLMQLNLSWSLDSEIHNKVQNVNVHSKRLLVKLLCITRYVVG